MTVQIITGDALAELRKLPDGAAHCCVSSPPYWGLRDYGVEGQLGTEPTIGEYVEKMVAVFGEVRRVLRDDGVLFLNIGDSYVAAPGGGQGKNGQVVDRTASRLGVREGHNNRGRVDGLKPKDLVGIPWRVAFALQADGWWLRSDIIWCLSGGTWLYARTAASGSVLTTVKDLARLDPASAELWNGERWTRLLGMSKSARRGDEIEIVLRSGERISCTPTHRFPTQRGLLAAGDLAIGDVLKRCVLPEPETPRDCALDEDAAWLAGLYLAEGSRSGDTIQIAGHAREVARWERLQRVAHKYGGTATRTVKGNCMDVRLYGRVPNAIIDELVVGHTARNKAFAPSVWRYSNCFIAAIVDGYLAGDGHWDARNGRWRLGFTRNYGLERDLRTSCARLGYKLHLSLSSVTFKGKRRPTFRGELRTALSGHYNEHDMGEVVAIRRARCREVYDLGVADEPNLFALASGVLTHNSKPNPMPESVQGSHYSRHRVTIAEYERLSGMRYVDERLGDAWAGDMPSLSERESPDRKAPLSAQPARQGHGQGSRIPARCAREEAPVFGVCAGSEQQEEVRAHPEGPEHTPKGFAEVQSQPKSESSERAASPSNTTRHEPESAAGDREQAVSADGKREGPGAASVRDAQRRVGGNERASDGGGLGGDREGASLPVPILWAPDKIDGGPCDSAEQGGAAHEGERGSGVRPVQQREAGPADSDQLVGCPGCDKCADHHGWILHLSAGRPTKAHEYVFLLAKSERYHYDATAIAEPASNPGRVVDYTGEQKANDADAVLQRTMPRGRKIVVGDTRNARSVWTIATQPFNGAHFATMPPKLAGRCILAGCPAGGTVLDPFGGAGTTGLVADRLGRDAILIELSPVYAAMARARITADAPLLAGVVP